MKLHWPHFSRSASVTSSPPATLIESPVEAQLPRVSPPLGEFLSFSLGNREYGVDMARVQEIRGYDLVTRIEDAPDFLQGVFDLRGVQVPVIDFRGLQPSAERLPRTLRHAAFGEFSVMIVLNVSAQLIGMVVDGVSDVMPFDGDHIAPASEPRTALIDRFISGVGDLGERMLCLLDIDRLVGSLDLPHIAVLVQRPH